MCVQFCFVARKSATETFQKFELSLGEETMSRIPFYWFSNFKGGVTSVDDTKRSGGPSTGRTDEYVARIKELIQ